MKNGVRIFLSVVSLVMFFSCSKIDVKKPEGFAEIRGSNAYSAISPEGVRYNIRYVKNYPQKELLFWKEALKNHMQDSGYMLVKEDTFSAASKSGAYFEWGAPFGSQNYIYLTAIIIYDREIVIAEAAGEVNLVSQYRNALLESIKTIKLN
ncbi:MAG: hypothetical protein JW969_10980 [Spirochaetales bacterium]|nr:hypothetical protein [Spirochaetales bacterium]